jgi:hypothetical protein
LEADKLDNLFKGSLHDTNTWQQCNIYFVHTIIISKFLICLLLVSLTLPNELSSHKH